MKIYTRRGDQGETDLLGGKRVAKDDSKMAACGTADELNALLGGCLASSTCEEVKEALHKVQADLFELGAVLATADLADRTKDLDYGVIDSDITGMEEQIDAFETELEPLKTFILPGGSTAGAQIHLARAVCRRLERGLIVVQREDALPEVALRYVNRLSDFLFVLARLENRRSSSAERPWTARKNF
jgi:cob(I)alamin adenosyltransferase